MEPDDGVFTIRFPPLPDEVAEPAVPARFAEQAAHGALKIGWAFAMLSKFGFMLVGPKAAESHPLTTTGLAQIQHGIELMDQASRSVQATEITRRLVVVP